MKIPNGLHGLGIPFYSEAEWLRAKTEMDDGDTFHDTYEEFVTRVKEVERELRREGQATIRVNLRMDEFAAWCRASGRKIDSNARAHYAGMRAMEHERASRKS